MSIDLTTATQSELSAIAATLSPPVLESLPAVTPSKAGEPFSYNGTLWTYAKTGQFGTLAEGTPWPVKGYKEQFIRADLSGNPISISALNIIIGDIDPGFLFAPDEISIDFMSGNITRLSVINTPDYANLIIEIRLLDSADAVPCIGYINRPTATTVDFATTSNSITVEQLGEIEFHAKLYPPQS